MDALKQDELFHQAVSAIDAGEVEALKGMLLKHTELVRERLEAPGLWLRERVGDALDGFFSRPYLLWFVAEDPVRNGRTRRDTIYDGTPLRWAEYGGGTSKDPRARQYADIAAYLRSAGATKYHPETT